MVNLPKSTGPFYRFRNSAETQGPAELLIYDVIEEGWGVSASTFARDLAALDADEITVRINSPGGSVYDGIAILNSLRGARQKVTTVVDGLAASAASFIAMAGEEIVMMPNAEMMIHNASGVCIGNADEMSTMSGDLKRISANIASIYASRTGIPADFWADQMANETWYSAQEAVDIGLANRVMDSDSAPNALVGAQNSWDLAVFNFAGRGKAPAPVTQAPSATAEAKVQQEKEANVATLKESLADRFGIDADAADEAFVQAVEGALAANVETPVEPTVEQAQQVAAQNGLVLIDAGMVDELRANAQLGAQARAQQLADADNAMLDRCVSNGQIPPARREHWLTQLQADREGATTVLNALPQVFNIDTAVGHGIAGSQAGSTANPGAQSAWDSLGLDKFEEFHNGKAAE